MKIKASKDDIYERKADSSGRISLPSSEFAGKNIELVVTEVEEDD